MTLQDNHLEYSKWPHVVAVVLVCATFPLIWVGGLVTTYDAGLAVPDWPTTYGYNMFLYPWTTWISGPWDLFIEHGHRLLGSLVGILTIALNVAIWKWDARRWMRWVALAALALVVLQGVLGGMRVRMMSTELARIHGCTGPVFFAFVAAISVMTSRRWFQGMVSGRFAASRGITIGAWTLPILAYAQLVLGAHLRHPDVTWLPGQFRSIVVFHIVIAVVLALQVFAVVRQAHGLPGVLNLPARMLVVLVMSQVVLGFATWQAKYGWPSFAPLVAETSADSVLEISIHNALVSRTVRSDSMSQAVTVTAHVAMGSLILATGVCYALRLSRAIAQQHRRMERSGGAPDQPGVICQLNADLLRGAVS